MDKSLNTPSMKISPWLQLLYDLHAKLIEINVLLASQTGTSVNSPIKLSQLRLANQLALRIRSLLTPARKKQIGLKE